MSKQRQSDGNLGFILVTATNSMAYATYLKWCQGSFTLLTVRNYKGGSAFTYLSCHSLGEGGSFRTSQHKGHPHPVLSRSTKRTPTLITTGSPPTELEARLRLALQTASP